MERSKIPLQKWCVAIFLVTTSLKSVSSMKLHRDLGITQKSAWFMLHRIRQAYELDEPLSNDAQDVVKRQMRQLADSNPTKEALQTLLGEL